MRDTYECRYCNEHFRLMYHRRVHEAEDCSARPRHSNGRNGHEPGREDAQ
jgi:hypothetical protein